mgnify:FL=1
MRKMMCTFVQHLNKAKTMKPYAQFSDKYGTQYGFENYQDFAKFWFSISYQVAKVLFPDFSNLQKYASNSREARKAL